MASELGVARVSRLGSAGVKVDPRRRPDRGGPRRGDPSLPTLRTRAHEDFAFPRVDRNFGPKPNLGEEAEPRGSREDSLDVPVVQRPDRSVRFYEDIGEEGYDARVRGVGVIRPLEVAE